jgi:hypothetical protein
VEVERGGVVDARRRLGGVEGADPHAPPLSQAAGCADAALKFQLRGLLLLLPPSQTRCASGGGAEGWWEESTGGSTGRSGPCQRTPWRRARRRVELVLVALVPDPRDKDGTPNAGGQARARADDAVAVAALREGDSEGRRRGKKEKNGGAHVWRGK